MKFSTFLFFCINALHWSRLIISPATADGDNLHDVCPTAPTTEKQQSQGVFFNGLPCKNPATVIASDFKTSRLNHGGDTDNFLRSSTTLVTAAEFPGLNTLGLSIARTDLEMDGVVTPHTHPRAAEMFFIGKGSVVAGFIDTKNQVFQKLLKEGDVFVFPRGLLHFCLNAGYDLAVVYSVLNSQNPGVVSITGAMFQPEPRAVMILMRRLISAGAPGIFPVRNFTSHGFPTSDQH